MYQGKIKIGHRYQDRDGSISTVLSRKGRRVQVRENSGTDLLYDWSASGFRARHTHEILEILEPMEPTSWAPEPPNPKAAYGATKPLVGLIPPVADLHEAMAMEEGARKYGAFNWRTNPVEALTYVHAARRHLDAWVDGQENSGDTSPPVHNLGHVRACMAILLDAIELGNLIDNRPPPGKAAEVQERMRAAKIEAGR